MNPELQQIKNELVNHRHNGLGDQRINLQDIQGLIRTVSVAPTHAPRNLFEQFVIYTNGVTYRFYWYDTTNNAWRYATGT